jgi:hypothetical protein
MKKDMNKFQWYQIFNNNDGKTSNSGVSGFYLVFIGGLCFITSMVGWMLKIPESLNVMSNILLLIGIGSGLLGVRKIFKDKSEIKVDNDTEENKG